MKLSQIFTAPNQLTLLRMVFVPFIVIELVEGRYFWALVLFVIARPISRPHCGQTLVEHHVSGALHSAQDSVEVYRAGVQPRYFDSGCQRRSICNRGTAQLPAQHFRKGQHFLTDRSRVLRDAVLHSSSALDMDYAYRLPARHVCLHDCFCFALCFSGATPAAFSQSCIDPARFRSRQLTLFRASP